MPRKEYFTSLDQLIAPVLSELFQLYPDSATSANKAAYLQGNIPHVSFRRDRLEANIVGKAIKNSTNRQDPRTYAKHAAEHAVFEIVARTLIKTIEDDPNQIVTELSEFNREQRALPSSRLVLTTREMVDGYQEEAIWARLGKEIANTGEKNIGKVIRRVAEKYGIPFSVLSAMYADVNIARIINFLSPLSEKGLNVPTVNRRKNKLNDGRYFDDISFLAYLRDMLSTDKGMLTVLPSRQMEVAIEVQFHPVWGEVNEQKAMETGYFPYSFSPLIIFESLSKLAEDLAEKKGLDLSNEPLARALNNKTKDIFVTRVVTGYREFSDTFPVVLAANKEAGLEEYLSYKF